MGVRDIARTQPRRHDRSGIREYRGVRTHWHVVGRNCLLDVGDSLRVCSLARLVRPQAGLGVSGTGGGLASVFASNEHFLFTSNSYASTPPPSCLGNDLLATGST